MSRISVFITIAAALVLSACTANNLLDRLSDETGRARLHIWFVKPAGDELALVRCDRPVSGKDLLKQAVEELLNGPTGQEIQAGLGSEIPRGTILLGISRQDNVIELNLSSRFASGGGSSSLETRLEQLRRTVAEPAGPAKVYLNIEGRRLLTAAGEGLEVKQPIN